MIAQSKCFARETAPFGGVRADLPDRATLPRTRQET